MYKQRNFIRDFIFPLSIAEKDDNGFTQKSFLGSAFLIGNNGFALTAAHVIMHHTSDVIISDFPPFSSQYLEAELITSLLITAPFSSIGSVTNSD